MDRRRLDAAVAAILSVAALQAAGASAHETSMEVRTLARIRGQVIAFDQDRGRLATLEWVRKGGFFVVRTTSGRRVARIAARFVRVSPPAGGEEPPSMFTFGGNRAMWTTAFYGNNQYQDLWTVTTRMRRPVSLGELIREVQGHGDGSEYSDADADGTVSVYGVMRWITLPGGVLTASSGKLLRMDTAASAVIPDVPLPAAVAVAGSRVAVVGAPRLGCACSSSPAWSPEGSSIAYATRTEDPESKVVIAPFGGDATRVSTAEGWEKSPSWSPDGTRLVYQSEGRIVISSRDGSGARQLTLGEDPAWSPNGDRIAFSKSAVPGLWVVNTDGSGERKIVDGSVSTPDWAPDGGLLAYTRIGENRETVEVFSLSGGQQRTLTRGAYPSWSPDGTRMAYATLDGPDSDVHVIRVDGSDDQALTANEVRDAEPDWSPDGTRIVFVRGGDEESESHLYTISSGGGTATRFTLAHPKPFRPLVEIRTLKSKLISRFFPTVLPGDIVLSSMVAAAISYGRRATRLELFDPSTGRRLGTASFPKNANGFSASHRTIVFAVGRRIWALDTRTRKQRLLATAVADPVGVSIEGRRVAWAENLKTTARIRALTVPR